MELEEGHSYTSVGHSEKSQEYIMIIEGQLKLEVNDSIYQLRENDSICFSAESMHTYHNQGENIESSNNKLLSSIAMPFNNIIIIFYTKR